MLFYVIVGGLTILVIGMISGVGKNRIFEKPESYSDGRLERTIRLTQRIMDNSPVGSRAWSENGAKFTAAFREQCRRRGIPYVEPTLNNEPGSSEQ